MRSRGGEIKGRRDRAVWCDWRSAVIDENGAIWCVRSSDWSLEFAGNVEGLWSPAMGSLSVFQKMRFEGKIKTEMILHPTHDQTEKHF